MLNTLTTPERVVRTARVQSNGIAASWHCSVFGGVRRKRYKICSFRISWFEFIAFETKWRRSDAHLSDDKATNIPPRLRRRHRPRCWRNAIVCGAIAAIGERTAAVLWHRFGAAVGACPSWWSTMHTPSPDQKLSNGSENATLNLIFLTDACQRAIVL